MRTKSKMVLVSVVILSVLIWGGIKLSEENDATIHIAFAGPMSGDSARVGQSMTEAIQLYLDTINKQGGINGQQVVLDIFDDANEADNALKAAQQIVEQNRAVAVIGHNYSACSINGGKVYKTIGIPAITPASTHVEVTQRNEWYFRTVFNDNLQARFLANYAKHILQQQTVSIIHTDTPYGSYLANQFEKTSRKLNMGVRYKWSLSSDNQENQMKSVVSELQTKSDAGLIFLATHAPEGVKLVKFIKKAGIKNLLMAPDSYASKRFSEGFGDDPKLAQDYYTNGLYVSTPFLLDTANRQAHYFNTLYQEHYQNQALPWHAFYAVDAAMVLINALKTDKIKGLRDTLVADRRKLRDALANHFNTVEQAINGNTGLNYFDDNGDATKSVSMGVYKNNHLISAFNQLQIVPRYSDKQLESTPQEGRILLIDDQYMYKKDVVYTGIQLNSISDFNYKKATYTLDFYLWFRFQGDLKPDQIHFLNAVEPIQLGTPIVTEKVGQQNYRIYRVKGQFKGNIHVSESHPSLTRHLLGVNFLHKELDRNSLIYVADVLGMELTNNTFWLNKIPEFQQNSLIEGWSIQEINFFQGIFKQKLLGNPKYLAPGNSVEYSTFNADIWLVNKIN